MIHNFDFRIFYEDTDLAGIVYYANYFKFIERGRSSLIRDAGIDQLLLKDLGCIFVVKKINAEYHASAKLDDKLKVETKLVNLSGAAVTFTGGIDLADISSTGSSTLMLDGAVAQTITGAIDGDAAGEGTLKIDNTSTGGATFASAVGATALKAIDVSESDSTICWKCIRHYSNNEYNLRFGVYRCRQIKLYQLLSFDYGEDEFWRNYFIR